jgi:hypothetical protein
MYVVDDILRDNEQGCGSRGTLMKTPTSQDFENGYIAGWQSLKPGSVPTIPSYAVPAGKTPYQHGYELGRKAAASR